MQTIIITQQPTLDEQSEEYTAQGYFSGYDENEVTVYWESDNDFEIKNIKKPLGYKCNGKFIDIEFYDVEFIHNY